MAVPVHGSSSASVAQEYEAIFASYRSYSIATLYEGLLHGHHEHYGHTVHAQKVFLNKLENSTYLFESVRSASSIPLCCRALDFQEFSLNGIFNHANHRRTYFCYRSSYRGTCAIYFFSYEDHWNKLLRMAGNGLSEGWSRIPSLSSSVPRGFPLCRCRVIYFSVERMDGTSSFPNWLPNELLYTQMMLT